MDDGPYQFIFILVLLVLASAYFASVEIAFTSVSKVRLLSRAENGEKRAERANYILDHFDKALTTILIGNNIAHISSATLATILVTRVWGQGAVTFSTIGMTVILFLFAEMLPKAFAKDCCEAFCVATAGSLYYLMKIFTPISFVFTKATALIGKCFHVKDEPSITEDELQDIIENVVEEGALDEEEGELVQSAFEFAGTTAKDILTPWEKTTRIKINISDEELLAFAQREKHSRIPITDQNDRPIGILIMRKYLIASQKGDNTALRSLMTPAHYIRSNMPIDDLLPDMSNARTQISIVLDENSRTLGIVTIEDVLEELVGEIYDEDDAEGRQNK